MMAKMMRHLQDRVGQHMLGGEGMLGLSGNGRGGGYHWRNSSGGVMGALDRVRNSLAVGPAAAHQEPPSPISHAKPFACLPSTSPTGSSQSRQQAQQQQQGASLGCHQQNVVGKQQQQQLLGLEHFKSHDGTSSMPAGQVQVKRSDGEAGSLEEREERARSQWEERGAILRVGITQRDWQKEIKGGSVSCQETGPPPLRIGR